MVAIVDPIPEARPRPIGPIGAALVAVDGAPPVDRVLEDLRREVRDVSMEPMDVFEADPDPNRSVLLVWAPPMLPADFYARVVAWADGGEPRIGLLGCAAQGTSIDSERALAAGFDDYVAGRASTRELAARIRAVFRRLHWSSTRRTSRLRYGPLVLHTGEHEVWVDGSPILLTGIEVAVLRALMQAAGRTLQRAELLDQAWGESSLEVSERAVDNVILRLRRKLPRPSLIRTVRGVGFRLDER